MKTPNGRDCPHYYQDFHRGRAVQECRLEKQNPQSLRWVPSDCGRCTVPSILSANASPHLKMTLTIKNQLLGLRRSVVVVARCEFHDIPIDDPYVGCIQCAAQRGGLSVFRRALEDNGEDDHTAVK